MSPSLCYLKMKCVIIDSKPNIFQNGVEIDKTLSRIQNSEEYMYYPSSKSFE